MNQRTSWPIIIGIALLASAWILGYHWVEARSPQRYVTVKGLAEREVRADQASWSIIGNYGAASVEDAQRQIERHEQRVQTFLTAQGFNTDEIKTSHINIYRYREGRESVAEPYNVEVRVTVTSSNVAAVEAASSKVSELIAQGILLSGDRWLAGPRYFFTGFQEIKPEMLAEATQNAKTSAEEFAKNSGSKVGEIKFANQGVFQILPASRNNDEAEFYADKLVRVVTTVDYFLR